MCKIIFIYGSGRMKGATTQALDAIKKGVEATGTETVAYHLAKLNYKGCIGCMACKKTGRCSLHDDLTPMYEELKGAGGIVLGAPIYMFAVSGLAKSWMDRLYALLDANYQPYSPAWRKLFTVYAMGQPEAHAYDAEKERIQEAMAKLGFAEIQRLTLPGKNVFQYPAAMDAAILQKAYEMGKKFALAKA